MTMEEALDLAALYERDETAWLEAMGASTSTLNYDTAVERTLDALAAHLAEHVDLDGLLALAR